MLELVAVCTCSCRFQREAKPVSVEVGELRGLLGEVGQAADERGGPGTRGAVPGGGPARGKVARSIHSTHYYASVKYARSECHLCSFWQLRWAE